MLKVVHIIPVGPNKESILESIKKSGYSIQKAYLILNKDYVEKEHKIADELEENLKALVDVQRISVELNVYKAAQGMLKVIKKEQEEGNKVLMNATGSTNITCMACYIAAQLSGSKFYWKFIEEVIPRVSSIAEIPLPTIKEINKDRITIIKTLQSNGGGINSIKDLINLMEGKASGKEYMAQRARINHYLKSLEEDNLIKTERKGKKMEIKLTELGWTYAIIN